MTVQSSLSIRFLLCDIQHQQQASNGIPVMASAQESDSAPPICTRSSSLAEEPKPVVSAVKPGEAGSASRDGAVQGGGGGGGGGEGPPARGLYRGTEAFPPSESQSFWDSDAERNASTGGVPVLHGPL
jgi:hypothetical protein